MAEVRWTYADESHRQVFGELLAPLVAAAGALELRRWDDAGYAKTQLRTWMLSLQDVPESVLRAAVAALVAQGVTWMPRPGDLRRACASELAARRKAAWQATLAADCPDCHGSRWQAISVNGVERLRRCACWVAAQQAMDRVGQALELPPSREDAYDEVTA